MRAREEAEIMCSSSPEKPQAMHERCPNLLAHMKSSIPCSRRNSDR